MRIIFIVTVSLLLLAGCGMLSGVIPSISPNVGVVAGNQVGDEIETVNNISNISPMMMVLMIAGWVLPTPQQMLGSCADFILRLFGRK